MSNTVSEAVARPVRTATQGGLAWALVETTDAFIWNMDDRQYGVAIVLLGILFSFIQTAIEDGIGKAFLRDLPPQPQPILEDEAGDDV